jgi:hypothetical protein
MNFWRQDVCLLKACLEILFGALLAVKTLLIVKENLSTPGE